MLKLPKKYHPDFAQPKIKPVGPVVIDHSVAPAGTKVWFDPNRELSGGTFTKQGDAYYNSNYFKFDGSGDYLDCGGPYDFMADETFTLVTVCSDFNLGAASQSLCGYGANSANQGWTLRYDQYATANKIGFTKFGVADGATTVTCPAGENVVIAVTFSGTNALIAVNGVVKSITIGNMSAPAAGQKFVIGGAWRTGAFANAGIFKCHMVAAIPGVVSAQRLLELSIDPYQILKPANDLYYFVPSGAGSTYTLTADSAAFSLAGDSVTFTAQRKLTADVAAYTLGGDNVTFSTTTSYTLAADVGAYSLAGDSVTFTAQRLITADVSAYTLGGDGVTFTYTPGQTLTADVGAYTIGGDSVTFRADRLLTADVAAYTLTGGSATFTVAVLSTPECAIFLNGVLTEAHFLTSYIDDNGEFYESVISGAPFFIESDINETILFLEGDVC